MKASQPRLPFDPPSTKTRAVKSDTFLSDNEYAASKILSNPERAREAEALPTQWAVLFLNRHRPNER